MTDPGSTTALPDTIADVRAECRPVVAAFADAGWRLFLVGGTVRDLFSGDSLDDADLDFTTNATPATVKALLGPIAEALWTQGERFGTIAAKVDGRLVEVTTHRAEAYDPDSRKPDVVFADDVLVDLSRRDFTINALAVELTATTPALIDPFGGIDDLRCRVLRTPLGASESFADDPLRMLRAARFVARLGLEPAPDVVTAMRAMRSRLDVVSAERIRDELVKLLAVEDPTAGLTLLIDTGLSERFLPELTLDNRDTVRSMPADPGLRLAALLAAAGDVSARRRLRSLRSSRHDVDRVATLVALVGVVGSHVGAWTDADVRRLAHRAGDHLSDLVGLIGAMNGDGAAIALGTSIDRLRGAGDLDDLRPALSGDDVMTLLGVRPGRDVGDALSFLLEVRLDEGSLTQHDAARRLEVWWSDRSA